MRMGTIREKIGLLKGEMTATNRIPTKKTSKIT